MPYVVTEPCFGCKHTLCVTTCPCDCFREGENMLFIDPDACIDCGQCVEQCPTNAIFPEADVPAQWNEYIGLNAEMAAVCPSITERRAPAA